MRTKDRLEAERRLRDELAQHKGEWVAIRDSNIVAVAPTRKQLRDLVSLGDIDAFFEVTPDEAAIQVL